MKNLNDLPISDKWPVKNSNIIQLYYLPTPNGLKVSIALRELGLEYEKHEVAFSNNDQFSPEFLSISPNNKIPAIVDPNGPNGETIGLFESGAILLYLAEKTGRLLPQNPSERYRCLQWLMFQMGGAGPMFGQFGHFFKFAKDKTSDKYALQRYTDETKRILQVVETQLSGYSYIAGEEYSIADVALFPWLNTLTGFYEASDALSTDDYPRTFAYAMACSNRPAVKLALEEKFD